MIPSIPSFTKYLLERRDVEFQVGSLPYAFARRPVIRRRSPSNSFSITPSLRGEGYEGQHLMASRLQKRLIIDTVCSHPASTPERSSPQKGWGLASRPASPTPPLFKLSTWRVGPRIFEFVESSFCQSGSRMTPSPPRVPPSSSSFVIAV